MGIKANQKAAIDKIEEITKSMNPLYPVEIKFVNDLYQEKLARDRTLFVLSSLFGGLSVLISCFGLIGLSAYTAV